MLRVRVPRIAASGLPPINGVASGTFPLSGSATGTVVVTGAASGTFPLSGSATGTVVISGVASGDFPLGGSATGTVGFPPINAIASGTFPLGGSATGTVVVTGTASGTFPLSGSATGIVGFPPINGVASGTFPLGGSATGTVNGEGNALAPNGGARREYQPYSYELQNRREIEKKFKEAELDLRATTIKIEALELKRTRDLADEKMQAELLMLLAEQNRLMQLIEILRQQKLRVLNDDEEFLTLLMYLN